MKDNSEFTTHKQSYQRHNSDCTKFLQQSQILAIFFLLIFPATAEEITKDSCYDVADPVRVKIGGAEFRIPFMYNPYLNTNDQRIFPKVSCIKNGVPVGGYMQEPDAPAFELQDVFIPEWGFGMGANQPEPNEKYPLFAFLDIHINGNINSIDKIPANHFFCYTKKLYKLDTKETTPWQAFNKAPGFFVSSLILSPDSTNSNTPHYYYSDKHTIFGVPVLIDCNSSESGGLRYGKPIGHRCNFQTAINTTHSIYIRFYDGLLTPDLWAEAFKQIEGFMRKISVNPLPDMKFTACGEVVKEGK